MKSKIFNNVCTCTSKIDSFFQCGCKRCCEPTELGTYSSALKCPKCEKGNVVPTDTKDTNANWSCEACNEKIHPDKIAQVTRAVKDAGDKLDADPKIEEFEKFLKKYASVLHPNHVIFIDKKYTLAKMYGRMPGYEASDLSDEQFQRKRQLCQDVLNLMDKIMPGQTRKRGMMLYEIHLPLVMLTNRYIQSTLAMTLRSLKYFVKSIANYFVGIYKEDQGVEFLLKH